MADLEVRIKTTAQTAAVTDLTAKIKGMSDAALKSQTAVEAAAQKLARLEAAAAKSGTALSQLKVEQASRELAKLEAGGTSASRGLGLLNAASVAAGVAMERLGEKAGETIKKVADLVLGLQDATDNLQNMADTSDKVTDEIAKSILDMSSRSIYGAKQLTDALAGSAGRLESLTGHTLTTADSQLVLKSATDLATASQQDLKTTTGGLISTMLAFQIPLNQVADTTDKLFNITRITGLGIDEFATAAGRLRDKIGTSAPPLEELGALVAELGAQGLTGSRGLLAVSGAIENLTSNSTSVNDTLNELGTGIFDAQGKFIGIRNVIAELQPIFAKLNDAQRNEAAASLFGAGAAGVMINLIAGGTSTFDSYTERVDKSGTATEAAARHYDDLGDKLTILKNRASAAAIGFGQEFEPAMTNIVDAIDRGADAIAAINDKLGLTIDMIPLIGPLLGALNSDWSKMWGDMKSVTETAVNFILAKITEMINGLGEGLGKLNDVVSAIPGASGALKSIGVDIGALQRTLEGFSAGSIDLTSPSNSLLLPGSQATGSRAKRPGEGGTGTDPSLFETKTGVKPPHSTTGGGGPSAAALQAIADLQALSAAYEAFHQATGKGVDDFKALLSFEQAKIDLDQRAADVTVALKEKQLEANDAGFQLRSGLVAIQEHLLKTGESIQQFISDTSTAALNGFKSAFDAIFNRPTKESAALQLQLDEAKRRVLLTSGDAAKKAAQADVDRIQRLIDVRRNAIDIEKDKALLADNTLLSDADALKQASLTITAINNQSLQTAQAIADTFLHAWQGMQSGSSGGSSLSLSDALVALYNLPDHGQSLLPQYAIGSSYIPRDQVAMLHAGEQVIRKGASQSPAMVFNSYITADSNASDESMRRLAKMVEERAEALLRRASFRGSYVTSGAYTPS